MIEKENKISKHKRMMRRGGGVELKTRKRKKKYEKQRKKNMRKTNKGINC